MLKKKSLMTVSVVFVIVLYLFSVFISFSNVKSTVEREFNESLTGIIPDMYGYAAAVNYDNEEFSPENLILYGSDLSWFSYMLYCCDEDNNVICQRQNYISFSDPMNFENRYCFIDDYITDENRKALKEICSSDKLKEEKVFNYAEEDGTIIPVSLVFIDVNDNETEIKFSDNAATESVHFPTHNISLGLLNYEFSNRMEKEYQFIYDNYSDKSAFENFGSTENSSRDDVYEDYIDIEFADGRIYHLYLVGKFSPVSYTLSNIDFRNQFAAISAVYAALLIVVMAAVSHFFAKYQIKAAKYSFANAAAHELKTPLAVIQNQCECILEDVNPQNNSIYVQSIYEESVRMNKLIQKLLQYNKLVSGAKIIKEEIDLKTLVKSETEKYSSLLPEKNLKIKAIFDDGCTVKCNGELIKLVIDNFLSNAIKFADGDSEIVVVLKKHNKKCQFSVFNKGKPIAKDNESEIWNMLYKDDESRKSDGNSSGMGLAISKQILELHRYKHGYLNSRNGVEFYFIAQ